MPILNYTTTIDVHKTVMEVQRKLASVGAKSISVDYDDGGEPHALTFLIEVQRTWVNFRLPVNWHGVLRALEKSKVVQKRYKNESQARRVAWRIIKDWTEAQIAIIEAGQAELPEVFLPYAVGQSGRTIWQDVQSGQLLLGSGE